MDAVQFLHDLNPPIIHGDIRGSNVLVSSEGQALLSDFGLCKLRHEVTRTLSRIGNVKEGGSSRYLAPEILNGDIIKWTPESDRYSLAMTFLELATLDRPFCEISNEYAVIIAVGQGRRPQRPPALGNFETEKADMFWELLESMWDHNPTQRLLLPHVRTRLDALCLPLPPVPTAPSRLDAITTSPQSETWQLGSHFMTPATELAPRRGKFVCPVAGCGSSFTRQFNLKGTPFNRDLFTFHPLTTFLQGICALTVRKNRTYVNGLDAAKDLRASTTASVMRRCISTLGLSHVQGVVRHLREWIH